LSWLPQCMADAYLRGTRRGERYDCRPLGRRELRCLLTEAGFEPRDATGDLIAVTGERSDGIAGRSLARIPLLGTVIRGPLLPTIVMVGRRPPD